MILLTDDTDGSKPVLPIETGLTIRSGYLPCWAMIRREWRGGCQVQRLNYAMGT